METNTRGDNYLDSDAHLPPRKRLLAGFKRQSSDVSSSLPSTSSSVGSDEYANRLNNLLRAQLNNPDISNDEIVEVSRFVATEAVKAAEAARAKSEEKASKAAQAMAAAKSALEFVATLTEATANKRKCLKKNKMKMHVNVRALYNKGKGNTNCRTDEELARNLHRTINRSPRILKNFSSSDVKNHKHKRLKSSTFSGKSAINYGVTVAEGIQPCRATSIGNGLVVEVDTEVTVKDIDMIMVDLNMAKSDQGGRPSLLDREGWQPNNTDLLSL